MSLSSKIHVLLIGIDAYPKRSLQGCVNDIMAFESVLRDRLQVPPESIRKLIAPLPSSQVELVGEAPTRDNILSALQRLAGDDVQEGDRVLIYYAGHGTRKKPWGGTVFAEALVPMDADGEPSKLIFDYQLGPLLQKIAARSHDCTVILDCCCSGGTFRALGGEEDSDSKPIGVRYCDMSDVVERAGSASAETPSEPSAGLTQVGKQSFGWLNILAAAQADEAASEVGVGQPPVARGALSYCFNKVLRTQNQTGLDELLWAELWTPLQREFSRLRLAQRPLLAGELGRPVFGGSAVSFDAGLPIARSGANEYVIEGGELAELTVGTRIAVYPPKLPLRFFPLESADDIRARIGVLTVDRVDGGLSYATVRDEFPSQSMLTGLRGRIIAPGVPAPLRVSLRPEIASWVEAFLRSEPASEIVCIDPESTPEVIIAQDRSQGEFGPLFIGDELYGCLPTDSPSALAMVSASGNLPSPSKQKLMQAKLLSALRHLCLYVRPLRLQKRAQRADSTLRPTSLKVTLLDMSDRPAIDEDSPEHIAMELQMYADRPVIPSQANGRYKIRSGQPIWLRIHNASPLNQRMFVTALICDSTGKVHVLNQPPILLPQGCGDFVWPAGMAIGQPLRFSAEWGDEASSFHPDRPLERLIVIATSAPVDLGFLALDVALQAAIDGMLQSSKGDSSHPGIEWTATRLVLEVEN